MLPSKLNLVGRPLEDIQREFSVLLNHLQAQPPTNATAEQIEKINAAWNQDINGWVNWLESLRK